MRHPSHYTPSTEAMCAKIDEQLIGARKLPEGARYALHGLTDVQLLQVKDFIVSFDPHEVARMARKIATEFEAEREDERRRMIVQDYISEGLGE